MSQAKLEKIVEYHRNGKIKCVYFVDENGIKQGSYKSYYDNDQPEEEYTYQDGKIDGLYERYYEDGRLEIKYTLRNGELDGLYEEYGESGWSWEKHIYKMGRQIFGQEAEAYLSELEKQEELKQIAQEEQKVQAKYDGVSDKGDKELCQEEEPNVRIPHTSYKKWMMQYSYHCRKSKER